LKNLKKLKNNTVKNWRIRNKEHCRLYKQQYDSKNRDRNKWYLKNKKYVLAYNRLYRKNNPTRVTAWNRRWARLNKIKLKFYKHHRRALGHISIKVIQKLYEENIKKYGTLTCVLCKRPILFGNDSLEHLLPISRGGTNEYSNLAITHLRCNQKKYNRTLKEIKGDTL
jgi:5-methylcytosine-specific restriction endonuclease McrA